MERRRLCAIIFGGCAFAFGILSAQEPSEYSALKDAIDPQIARAIAAVKAIDNHAHPVLPPPNNQTDRDFDVLPVDNMEPQTDPVAWREDNRQLPAAWKALWAFDGKAPLHSSDKERLSAARQRIKAQEGPHYDEWVLDQLGIET